MGDGKLEVLEFWNDASCGERLLLTSSDKAGYLAQMRERYRLEPYIPDFAAFETARDRDILEIGVGLGADHHRFAESGARLTGVDLTERAIAHTRRRLELFGFHSNLHVGDAEGLQFPNQQFDIVYSWGVLHHSPNTAQAVADVFRVLRPAGQARVMIYHKHALVGYMLWIRYALLRGRPWTGLDEIYAKHLESPGTKAYTVAQARELFRDFSQVTISTVLTHGDLLESDAGQRHRGWLLTLAKRLWPRRLLRWAMPRHGLFMMILAVK